MALGKASEIVRGEICDHKSAIEEIKKAIKKYKEYGRKQTIEWMAEKEYGRAEGLQEALSIIKKSMI